MAREVVTDSSTVIAHNDRSGPDYGTKTYLLKNRTRTASVFLEIAEEEATAEDSFEWEMSDWPIEVELEPGESVKGIVDTGEPDQTIHVLEQGR